ncbi:phycocyanobilin lyase [filamentous cyanobacterium CCP5]|nr:phycocyanobilin lyase [filamentous cyanobacterium CCT1]PSN18350.1 phycocyanobilin lyase [filamentous cyanobacterium CCP5]
MTDDVTANAASLPDLAALIRCVETADSREALVRAVWQLSAARDVAALPTLIQALGYNNPGAAVAAVDGLVKLGKSAVPALLKQLDGYNYGARAWAIRALALIRDPRALQVLIETASGDFALSVRRAAAKGIGTLDWSLLPFDQRTPAQHQVLDTLFAVTADPEWVVRYAAIAGLEALALAQPELQSAIVAHLHRLIDQDDTLAVKARCQLAIATIQTDGAEDGSH